MYSMLHNIKCYNLKMNKMKWLTTIKLCSCCKSHTFPPFFFFFEKGILYEYKWKRTENCIVEELKIGTNTTVQKVIKSYVQRNYLCVHMVIIPPVYMVIISSVHMVIISSVHMVIISSVHMDIISSVHMVFTKQLLSCSHFFCWFCLTSCSSSELSQVRSWDE